MHWGRLLPAEKLNDTLAVEGFLASARVQSRVTRILTNWNHEVVARNLTAIEAGDRPSVPIVAYCRAVRVPVDPMDRFRQMCSYLDGRGRSELTGTRAGRG